jgi:hypothetical protein
LKWKKEVYLKRLLEINTAINYDQEVVNKMVKSYLSTTIDLVEKNINELSEFLSSKNFTFIQKDYQDAVTLIESITEEYIQNQISTLMASLLRGYQSFSTDFQNISITGPTGVGKTTLAVIISQIFKKMHLISSDVFREITRSGLVSYYPGQTSNKTKIELFGGLEGIIFIDEAYQLGGYPKEDVYGMESLKEILSFLESYIGISIVIVAGYEKEMEKRLFVRNERLRLCFPIRYQLYPCSSPVLFKFLLIILLKNYQKNIFAEIPNSQKELIYLYQMIRLLKEKNLLPKMGGSVQILAGKILRYYLSLGDFRRGVVSAVYEYLTQNVKVIQPDTADSLLKTLEEQKA